MRLFYSKYKREILREAVSVKRGASWLIDVFYEKGSSFLKSHLDFSRGDLPNCSFTDGFKGMNPVIINGNLKRIK